ncbi:MAG: ribbon-helix-helix domain-containing protein [Lachnospiraceae bacterium]|nr:ribbon-helix-helix domain-containing protein [Lachnospiraceae bacterium]
MEEKKRKAGRPRSANPKNVNVGLRMTDEQYQKLRAYAESKGMTVSKVLLEALEAYIK